MDIALLIILSTSQSRSYASSYRLGGVGFGRRLHLSALTQAEIFFFGEVRAVRGRRSEFRSPTVSLFHSFPSRAVQKLQFKHPVNRMPLLSISLQICQQI